MPVITRIDDLKKLLSPHAADKTAIMPKAAATPKARSAKQLGFPAHQAAAEKSRST